MTHQLIAAYPSVEQAINKWHASDSLFHPGLSAYSVDRYVREYAFTIWTKETENHITLGLDALLSRLSKLLRLHSCMLTKKEINELCANGDTLALAGHLETALELINHLREQ
jgi:hypothetical protein